MRNEARVKSRWVSVATKSVQVVADDPPAGGGGPRVESAASSPRRGRGRPGPASPGCSAETAPGQRNRAGRSGVRGGARYGRWGSRGRALVTCPAPGLGGRALRATRRLRRGARPAGWFCGPLGATRGLRRSTLLASWLCGRPGSARRRSRRLESAGRLAGRQPCARWLRCRLGYPRRFDGRLRATGRLRRGARPASRSHGRRGCTRRFGGRWRRVHWPPPGGWLRRGRGWGCSGFSGAGGQYVGRVGAGRRWLWRGERRSGPAIRHCAHLHLAIGRDAFDRHTLAGQRDLFGGQGDGDARDKPAALSRPLEVPRESHSHSHAPLGEQGLDLSPTAFLQALLISAPLHLAEGQHEMQAFLQTLDAVKWVARKAPGGGIAGDAQGCQDDQGGHCHDPDAQRCDGTSRTSGSLMDCGRSTNRGGPDACGGSGRDSRLGQRSQEDILSVESRQELARLR